MENKGLRMRTLHLAGESFQPSQVFKKVKTVYLPTASSTAPESTTRPGHATARIKDAGHVLR